MEEIDKLTAHKSETWSGAVVLSYIRGRFRDAARRFDIRAIVHREDIPEACSGTSLKAVKAGSALNRSALFQRKALTSGFVPSRFR